MKHKVKIWYPVTTTFEDEIEVEIPHDVDDIEDWLSDNKSDIIEEASHEHFEDSVYDYDYAGCKLIKE